MDACTHIHTLKPTLREFCTTDRRQRHHIRQSISPAPDPRERQGKKGEAGQEERRGARKGKGEGLEWKVRKEETEEGEEGTGGGGYYQRRTVRLRSDHSAMDK